MKHRDGVALLSPIDIAGEVGVELFEAVAGGRVLHSTVRINSAGAEHVTAPADRDLETSVARMHEGTDAVRITLGQARTFLESLPAMHRRGIMPLLDRLADIPGEALVGPQPSRPFEPEEAQALVAEKLWHGWRPFHPWIAWPEEMLHAAAKLSPQAFPGRYGDLLVLSEMDVTLAYGRRRVATRVSLGLRHMALIMHLRGDARAPRVAAEAILASRKRGSSLARALAERERWLQLWTDAALPPTYREEIRQRLREALAVEAPGWTDVRLLDFAQAAAEGLAREAGEIGGDSGLVAVESLDLDQARRLAGRAVAAFSDRDFVRRVRSGQHDLLAETARGWVESAHGAEILQLVRLVGGVCFGSCPHRCFDPKPQSTAEEAFAANAPPA